MGLLFAVLLIGIPAVLAFYDMRRAQGEPVIPGSAATVRTTPAPTPPPYASSSVSPPIRPVAQETERPANLP